jgi:hypothetical protein
MAVAQQSRSDSLQLEEIIVTAEKRESTVQTTPISLTAVTGADIQDRGLADLDNHPIRDEERQHHLLIPRQPIAEYGVHVHIPEPWNQVPARAIHGPRVGGGMHGVALAELDDAPILDDDGHIRLWR